MQYNKRSVFLASAVGVIFLLGCVFWLSLRKVEITSVHQSGTYSDIIVKKFPITTKGKINWWVKNRDMLIEKYQLPVSSSDDYFAVTFWDYGKGYRETDGYDSLCFDDMEPPVNCIDKDSLLMVRNSKNTGIYFLLDDGEYRLNNKGDVIKSKRD